MILYAAPTVDVVAPPRLPRYVATPVQVAAHRQVMMEILMALHKSHVLL